MDSPADNAAATAAPWQQQQQQQQQHAHQQAPPYFPSHPPPGTLPSLNSTPSLPYPLTGGAAGSASASSNLFDPLAPSTTPSNGGGSSSSHSGFHAHHSLAHRRNNSLAASTSSTDSGFSDLNDSTMQLRSSTRSDQTVDSSFDAGNTTVTPLRHSRRDLSSDHHHNNHPSGLTAPPTLLDQELHQDGRPRRPMNAFMIYARHRRPEFQKNEPGLKTGDLSKRLSAEWKALDSVKKSFYLEQAKILKDHFHERFPTYVYRRRPNNQGRRSRHARSARGSSGSGRGSSTDSSDSLGSAHSPGGGSGSPGFVSPVGADFPSAAQYMSSSSSGGGGGGGGAAFRLHSSLGSSTGSSIGSGSSSSSSRPYDPPPSMLQIPGPGGGRHPHDFDQSWPPTSPQPYSPAPSSATSQMYSPYSAYGLPPSTQRWDPNFARSYDGPSNPLSRTWTSGYAGGSSAADYSMPYPYSVSAPMNRSNEQLPVSSTDADYTRYTKAAGGLSLSMSMGASLPSPGLSSNGSSSRDAMLATQSWMPPAIQLPPWQQQQQNVLPPPPQSGSASGYGANSGSAHSSSSESLPHQNNHPQRPPSSASANNNKYYNNNNTTFTPASLMQQQQPGDPPPPDSHSPSLPPASQLSAEPS